MPTINQTIQKVHSFAELPLGWYYGEGEPPNIDKIQQVERFLLSAEQLGIEEANAFPGAHGQIEVTFYFDQKTYAFMFETDDRVSITEEKRGEIISDIYDQPYEVAEEKLWELSQKIQTIYDSSTLNIGTQLIKDLGVRRFNAPQKSKIRYVGSHSFPQNASLTQNAQSVSTSRTTTVRSQATPSFFFVLNKKNYQTT